MNKGGEGVLKIRLLAAPKTITFGDVNIIGLFWSANLSKILQKGMCVPHLKKMCQETLLHLSADTYRYINLIFFYNPLSTFSGD